MLPDSEKINIVVACDNHYVIMLVALLKSIEKSHKSQEHIDIYIVDDNVSVKSKKNLLASVSYQIFTLHWIDINKVVPKGITMPLVNNSYPLNTYVRLFIPYFVPKGIKKVLFMDVDMLVLNDISVLWNIDIGNYTIGAVTDSITRFVGNVNAGGISNYKELGLTSSTKYFNAGLQLINIDKWIENDITNKVLVCINKNRKYADMGDQYGLNAVMAGQYHEIDPLWNFMANGQHPAPHVIHFIHRKPFYKSYFNNPDYRRMFYEYLSETKWKHTKAIGEPRRYLKKISNMLEKVNLLFLKKIRQTSNGAAI